MPLQTFFAKVKPIDAKKPSSNNQQYSTKMTTKPILVVKKVIKHCKRKLLKLKKSTVASSNELSMVNFRVKQAEGYEQYDISPTTPTYTQTDYNSSILRLSDYLKVEDPMNQFYNFDFICDSSVEGCKLYSCNSMSQPKDKFVMKITKVRERNSLIETENELKLMRACSTNKNIAKVHSVIGHEGCIWIAMDYCQHGSLYKFMETYQRKFNENQISYMCQQILDGIKFMHEEQFIMHLDIKPDNVLVDENFNLVITDFGSSVQLDSYNSTFDKFRGTPYWIAPEMIPKERCYTNKVDIWSFGVLVWELMHGKPPRYDKEDLFELLSEIRYLEVPQLDCNHDWSPELVDFLYKALDKNPRTRWSASQLLNHTFIKKYENTEGSESYGKQLFSII